MMQRGSGIYTNSWSQWFREDYHGIWLLDVVLMRFLISSKELPLRYRERDYGKQFLLIYGNNYGHKLVLDEKFKNPEVYSRASVIKIGYFQISKIFFQNNSIP